MIDTQANGLSKVSANTDVHYEECQHTRSELYLNTLPLINSGAVALVDNERMMLQLVSLERTTTAVRDWVDHPKGMHDDLANAAAGARLQLFAAAEVSR